MSSQYAIYLEYVNRELRKDHDTTIEELGIEAAWFLPYFQEFDSPTYAAREAWDYIA